MEENAIYQLVVSEGVFNNFKYWTNTCINLY